MRQWEDKNAVVAPGDGTLLLRHIAAWLPKLLRHDRGPSLAVMEMDPHQTEVLQDALESAGMRDVRFRKDQFGLVRCVESRLYVPAAAAAAGGAGEASKQAGSSAPGVSADSERADEGQK